MKKFLIVIVVLLLVALGIGDMYVGRRNQMIVKNQAVVAAWSQLDVVLQRRANLIPKLIETLKGIAAQEQNAFGDIAKARSALVGAQTPAERIAANGQVDNALGRLLAIAGNYPQLKSDESFLTLQDELAGTENRIAVERRRYNEAIQDYNAYIGIFPNNMLASWAGFKPNNASFAAAETSGEAPSAQAPVPATK
jgi:LemA protein